MQKTIFTQDDGPIFHYPSTAGFIFAGPAVSNFTNNTYPHKEKLSKLNFLSIKARVLDSGCFFTFFCSVGRRCLRGPSSGYCRKDTFSGRSCSANN